jgi:pimeloyl-ACP methyl ester carboxylesterase
MTTTTAHTLPRQEQSWPAWAAVAGLLAVAAAGCAYYILTQKRHRSMVAGPAGQLAVDDGGSGDALPVLFVHSYAGSTTHWDAVLMHLRHGRRAVALDLRGHGLSDAPADYDYAVTALAEDVAAVADSLQLDRFVLVGHSLGGMVAAEYAGKNPERVAGLVLVATPGKAPPELANKVMASLENDYDSTMQPYWESMTKGARSPVKRRLDDTMRKLPRESTKALVGAMFANDPLAALAAYTGPKMIIDTPHGDGPSALYRQAPQIPRQLITGTSHWPHLDEPQKVNTALDAFLANARWS